MPDGHVDVSWAVDAARLRFTWKELSGPVVTAPTRQSFGTRLIETLGRQLKGDVKLSYQPDGFVYVLDVPLASLEA
jgi:two-component sensor histidine kinase